MYYVRISEEWTIPEVARKTGISEARLRKAFEEAKVDGEICRVEMAGDPPALDKDR